MRNQQDSQLNNMFYSLELEENLLIRLYVQHELPSRQEERKKDTN